MKEIIGVLSKTLNLAESELSSTLLEGDKFKDGAAKILEGKFAEHYKKITDEADAKRVKEVDDTKGRVLKETAEKFERAISEHVPGIDKSLKGDDLLKQLPSAVSAIRTAKDEPEKIKTSMTYIEGLKATEEKLRAEYDGKIKEKDEALAKLQQERESDKVNSAILKKVSEFEDTLKLRSDIDSSVISTLKETAKANLLSRKSKLSETGDVIFLDPNGEVSKDNLGHIVKLENLITEAYQPLVKLTVASENRNDGGKPGEGGQGAGPNGQRTIASFGLTKPTDMIGFDALVASVKKLQNEGKIDDTIAASLMSEGQKSVLEALEKSQT